MSLIQFFIRLFKKTDNNSNNTADISETNINNYNDNNENDVEETLVEDMFDYNGKVIILDNGHARQTSGKRSPLFSDGKTRFFEYEFNRDVVNRIARKLDNLGIRYYKIVPEVEEDIALSVRANRVNKLCNQYGAGNCVLISVHANAAGNGTQWMNARGWSVWTTKGVTKSDAIATIFWEEANKLLPKYRMTMRKDNSDGDPDNEANFTIIYKALCPAILTENLFYDNKVDVDFLMSDLGREVIADIHVNAIKRICKK